ncbi:MAG: thioredoxin domain-containing protein [Myxococcota bacterium]|nr:thioredoxin domain-containing protein [Myxococcota bacterium]
MKQQGVAAVGLAASFVPVIGGVAASAALLVDYLRPRPVFCAVGGGCDAVRHTAFAAPLGIPMPAIGVTGFLAIGVIALVPGRRARLVQLALSAIAGVVGLLLLGVQASMGDFCPYCVVSDACGIASAVAAGGRLWQAAQAAPPRGLTYAGAGGMVLATLLPLVGGFRASGVPKVIREQISKTSRGAVTIVDFVDFECPFCRMTHAELEPLVEAHNEHIRLVRLQVPLRSHPHALDAALASGCGDQLGKGDAMANALFAAPVDQLTPEGCERLAQSLSLPLDAYRACIADPGTAARIEKDRADFKAAGGYALPTIWIDELELVGAQPRDILAHAIETARRRTGS